MSSPTWAYKLALDGEDWSLAMRDPPKEDKKESEKNKHKLPTDLNWMPARVPGNVQLDLHANKKIPDPYLGQNLTQSEWVEKKEYYYKKEFQLNLRLRQCAQLIFFGLDYIADLWINNHYVGKHVGMFSHWIVDITEWIQKGNNAIVVRLAPPETYAKNRLANPRMQMNYGWDIAPRCLTAGIWDCVELKVYFRISITHNSFLIKLDPDEKGDNLIVPIIIEGDISDPEGLLDIHKSATVKVELFGKNFQSDVIILQTVIDRSGGFTIRAVINAPQLWMPWDRGTPNLYTARMKVIFDNRECDREEISFGIREINRVLNTSWQEKDLAWSFNINGVFTYIRGANWVPADIFPGRVKPETYRKYLTAAKELGINLLRVWGGGLREKSAFYEIANELGIMIWQEFPVACVTFPFLPKEASFRRTLGREARSIVETLRNHPCVIQWCGGNEINVDDNEYIFQMLQQIVDEFDGTRPWQTVSPMEGRGERHNYEVWHGYAPQTAYFSDDTAFISEFGMPAFPSIDTLKQFLPEKARDRIFSKSLLFHNPQTIPLYGATMRHKRYALPFISKIPPSLGDFVDASQKAQARAFQTAIEHYRCERPENSGCMFWQLNEPWPSIGFAPIDYYFRKKRSYAVIKRVFNPLLISSKRPLLEPLGYSRRTMLDLTIVNDGITPFMNVTITGMIGTTEILKRTGITIPENNILELPPEEVTIPRGAQQQFLSLEIRSENGDILATNEYDLNYYDPFTFILVRKLVGKLQEHFNTILLKSERSFLQLLFPVTIYAFCMGIANIYVFFKWLWMVRFKKVRDGLHRLEKRLKVFYLNVRKKVQEKRAQASGEEASDA